jgi:small-conductance mechanosensitive channel
MNDSNLDGLIQTMQLFEMQKLIFFASGILVLFAINRLLKKIAETLGSHFPSKRLLILQVITIAIFLIYILGVVAIFYGALRPSKELILALGGSIAVAMGLALKDIVSSLVAGLVLLFDQPFQVGDRVNFNGEYGEIKSIGLRTVRINTLDDNLVTIPNSRFLTDIVSSGNSGKMDMMVVSDFYIALDADLKKAEEIIKEAIVVSEFSYLKKPINIVVNEVVLEGIIALQLKAKSYVIDVKYEKAFQSDVVRKVRDWFNDEGIKRPVFNINYVENKAA